MWYEQTMMVWTDLIPLRLHLRHREADEVRPFDELGRDGRGGAAKRPISEQMLRRVGFSFRKIPRQYRIQL